MIKIMVEKTDKKQPEVVSTGGLKQNKGSTDTKQQASNITQSKEAKSAGNILQATLQKMFNLELPEKARSTKNSKDSSASCSESEDERLDRPDNKQGNYCEVMEYCAGGDLYSLIASHERLEQEEADCFFGQLINGVKYLHDNGVAHRDLKPENLLLTLNGCLKITDFGNGECFRMAWETQARMSRGICGSEPYIAPEEFIQDWFDPRLVDIWACGIIYMGMITGRHLWRIAKENEDNNFRVYLEARAHGEFLSPFQKLSNDRRRMMSKIIEPNPKRRITTEQIIEDSWFSGIDICYRPLNSNHSLPVNATCGSNCNVNQKTMREAIIENVV
ncbi:14554_t:CDS:2 [Acaulospora colombiana]|uniref:14554_t:CDS:1 n=1 Tax=Acaulospora colombiana TaxID=27376 RepID=A0ACA9KKD0_9GLOM|nr:14554_t:CDS:2 [Acaulospora colombiana]